MLDVSSPEALFGSDAVDDRKKLRRAYAKLIKRFRPETSPDEFTQIHDLYQKALARLKGARKNRLADVAPPVDPEALRRQQQQQLEDLPPPKWKSPERKKRPDREPEPPDWKKAEADRKPEAPPPDWKKVESDAKPEAPPAEWKKVEPDGKPDAPPPEWKRADPDAPPDRGPAPEWQRVEPDRGPEPPAPEAVDVDALQAAIDEAWARIRTEPDAAIERLRELAEHAPHAAKAWLAWAAAVSTRDQAPPREPLRAAMRSPARDEVVDFLVELADVAPDGFYGWMDTEIIQAASRAHGFHDLVEQWWTMTQAFGKPKAIQAAARAIVDLPVRFDARFMGELLADAAENAFWAGRRPWLKRWRREVRDLRTDDPELTRRLDSVSWLLDHADEIDELLLHDDLMPVIDFLRTAWTLPDELLRGPWQRHLVGLREHGAALEQVAIDVNALAPGLSETYLELMRRVPLHLSESDHAFIRGWLQRQEQVVDQHPLRIWYHVKLWPVYLAVLAAGLVLPIFLFLAIPVYRVAEGKLRYKIYNDYVRRAFAHLCRTHGYARLEVLHVLEGTRTANLQDMRHSLEQDIDIDVEGASLTRTR